MVIILPISKMSTLLGGNYHLFETLIWNKNIKWYNQILFPIFLRRKLCEFLGLLLLL